MTALADLPGWVTWQQRPFPDANLLLFDGSVPALIDSGFVAHARETADWTRVHAPDLALVVNMHWHADHVGGNALLQSAGVGVAASTGDAQAVNLRDPGCCVAEYLDQPVAAYAVDQALEDGQVLRLGDADWEVIATPGHTPGHLCLWQPDERLLVVGDALSDYDVGWVNLALDGPDVAFTASASLRKLVGLEPRVVLPAHGAVPTDTAAVLIAAVRRTQRLVDDPQGAVWYGARRIFAFALMIHNGIPINQIDSYLQARTWLTDAARQLQVTPEVLSVELVDTMSRSGAVTTRHGRLHAAAEHTRVDADALNVPFPNAW